MRVKRMSLQPFSISQRVDRGCVERCLTTARQPPRPVAPRQRICAEQQFWIHELKKTWFGDANLNGQFSSADLVQVFQAGRFETGQSAHWENGDWNGDDQFTTRDFTAFQEGGCEQGPRPVVAIVPEPITLFPILLAMRLLVGDANRVGQSRNDDPGELTDVLDDTNV
jgi:hypothetical protein